MGKNPGLEVERNIFKGKIWCDNFQQFLTVPTKTLGNNAKQTRGSTKKWKVQIIVKD